MMVTQLGVVDAVIVESGIIFESFSDRSRDCDVTQFSYENSSGILVTINPTDVTADQADELSPFPGFDTGWMHWWWVVIHDAYGNPIAATHYAQQVGTIWKSARSDAAPVPEWGGFVAPQAKSFIAKIYDTGGSVSWREEWLCL